MTGPRPAPRPSGQAQCVPRRAQPAAAAGPGARRRARGPRPAGGSELICSSTHFGSECTSSLGCLRRTTPGPSDGRPGGAGPALQPAPVTSDSGRGRGGRTAVTVVTVTPGPGPLAAASRGPGRPGQWRPRRPPDDAGRPAGGGAGRRRCCRRGDSHPAGIYGGPARDGRLTVRDGRRRPQRFKFNVPAGGPSDTTARRVQVESRPDSLPCSPGDMPIFGSQYHWPGHCSDSVTRVAGGPC